MSKFLGVIGSFAAKEFKDFCDDLAGFWGKYGTLLKNCNATGFRGAGEMAFAIFVVSKLFGDNDQQMLANIYVALASGYMAGAVYRALDHLLRPWRYITD
ncbi:hypothetical protein BH11PAT2_BH11PAT2_09410 [soil metagenome]